MLSLSERDITPGEDRVENHERRPFRDLGDLVGPHNRFDIKGPEATREQDEVRRLRGKQRGLVSTWGCVDDDEVGPTLLRRPEKLLKHLRVIAHDLGFGIAPDTPLPGTGLGVEVDNNGPPPFRLSVNGQVSCKRGFSHPALLGHNSNGFHDNLLTSEWVKQVARQPVNRSFRYFASPLTCYLSKQQFDGWPTDGGFVRHQA